MIDIHTHFLPRSWPDLAARFGSSDWPWMKHTGAGRAMLMVGEREFRPVTAACWDASVRLEAMDRDGVDVQIMCATPLLFAYERPAAQALECARIFNAAAREICERAPQRLKSLCQVPLQDTELACRARSSCASRTAAAAFRTSWVASTTPGATATSCARTARACRPPTSTASSSTRPSSAAMRSRSW